MAEGAMPQPAIVPADFDRRTGKGVRGDRFLEKRGSVYRGDVPVALGAKAARLTMAR